MVAVVDPVSRVTRVPRVVLRRDRPERVAGLDDVALLRPRAVRGPCERGPRDERQSRDEEDLSEHVFAMVTRTSVRVKRRASAAVESSGLLPRERASSAP